MYLSKKIISRKNIRSAKVMVLKELSSLQADYFPELSSSDFLINHIYLSSPMLLRLQSRCFFKGLADEIISDNLLKFVKEHIDSFTLYHLVFLRIHHPDMLSNSIERKDNVTASPLHYDNYVANSRTTWIPLQDIDESTGSLCYTSDKQIIEMTGNGLSPSDLHDSKINNEIEYIDLLKKHISTIKCNEGQVVIFDNLLLHGGSYSQSKMRITVDLRWIENNNRKYERPGSISENLKLMKCDMLTSLYILKDYKFIYRETLQLKYIYIHIKATLKRFTPLKKIVKSFRQTSLS